MRERLTLERELAELGTRNFERVVQPGEFSSDQNTADEHELREFTVGGVPIPEQKVIVKEWIKPQGITFIKAGAAARSDNKSIMAKWHGSFNLASDAKVQPLTFGQAKRMWIRAGESGQINMFLEFEYDGAKKAHFRAPNVSLDLSCTAEGRITLTPRPSLPRRPSKDYDLGIDIQVYQRKDKPKNRGMRGIPAPVWDEWMQKLCILRIVMIAKLTVTNGPGWLTVEVKDASSAIPDLITAGARGPSTAELGPMIVDLVPTGARPFITAKQGLIQDVYFGRNSSEIDKVVEEQPNRPPIHQGTKLDAWIRDDLIGRWDVREALYRGDLPIRGEARASATFKGKNSRDLLRYNQALSEKRRDAVVSRLKNTLSRLDRDIKLDATQLRIEPIGASKAPVLGEENVYERRCRLQIDAADLEAAIKELYKDTTGWWWDR